MHWEPLQNPPRPVPAPPRCLGQLAALSLVYHRFPQLFLHLSPPEFADPLPGAAPACAPGLWGFSLGSKQTRHRHIVCCLLNTMLRFYLFFSPPSFLGLRCLCAPSWCSHLSSPRPGRTALRLRLDAHLYVEYLFYNNCLL